MADILPNHTLYVNNLNEKVKKDELKRSLHAIFTQFGELIQLMSFRKERMRGQAHVVFKEVSSASNALRALQGFAFYGKPLRIQYAREDSDVISRAKGTFVEKRTKTITRSSVKKPHDKPSSSSNNAGVSNNELEEGPGLPNKILFCSNIPEDIEQTTLEAVFNQFPGVRDIRVMPNNKGIAFVEFDSEDLSEPARQALDNFRITPDHQIKVKFANK
ncbi:unnamed protein product [Caenorhabditis angaria]|uniref:RRM domain-containing protein n=1 Tax=Caenorhabditis angaria TaxID=860376 RepID=A0A9P1IP88_9PELO|nr:unnamed protein product [Caenorhabditis angaria]